MTHFDQRIPLPHGTEVTTRIDRALGDGTLIPAGAVGRVIAVEGSAVTVRVVGVGDARFDRAELVPRKAGQMRYAQRRHEAWEALHDCRVIDAVVGSRAWGLADETSDVDRRGVFVLPFPWTTGLVEPPLELSSTDGSETYWEVGKAVRQALRADPNTLEMLFLPGARALDELGAWLLEARDAFVSIEIYGTFGRYALSQLARLRQSSRLAEHRALLLEWLAAEPLDLDAAAARLARATEIQAPTPAEAVHRAREYIKQLYSSLYDQGLLAERNYEALVALARAGTDFELPRELRPKNAYNLLRLIATATEWLRDGEPTFEVRAPLRDELVAIKRGEVPLAEVIARADAMTAELEAARRVTRLPERADVGTADRVLRRIRAEAARRWARGDRGPFGADAPPLEEATWE
ncbi:MAG TPA: nucleotidyltransferase domain-containing protein [Kofleriaceae bacterium]|nr:nucleotidyltransferase domain-containing protein [Kofleriaceae bacterium]